MKTREILLPLLACTFLCGVLRADLKELDSYVLCSDDFVTRPAKAAESIFYSTDLKLIAAKLKEYGLKFPDNMNFPQGGLFVIAVTDHVKESFQSVSLDAAKHLVVLDLAADKDAAPPKPGAGQKASRVLVVACPPMNGIKTCGIKTADGVVHTVATEQLKK